MPKHRDTAPEDEPITLDVEWQRLIASGRAAFASEIAFQKARAALAGRLIGRIAGLGALALALVFFILMALVVGSLLALAPMIGAWGALGVVVLVLVLGIAACVAIVLATLRALKRVLKDDGA